MIKIYTDKLAEQYKECAGQKWQPSDNSEFQLFAEKFCDQCMHGRRTIPICKIFFKGMAYDYFEEEYPKEWQYGTDGQPTCTAFRESIQPVNEPDMP